MTHTSTTTRIGATLFSGGRIAEALLTDLIDFRYAVEYDSAIAAVGAQLGGHTFVSRVEDVDYSTWGALDYLHASPVCFPAGTTVLTKRGIVPIEQVVIGDEVVTHTGRYMPVTQTYQKQAPTIKLIGHGHWGMEATADHPFYALTSKHVSESHKIARAAGRPRKTLMVFSDPQWTPAAEMQGKYWLSRTAYPALEIPAIEFRGNESLRGQQFTFTPEFFWIVGAWLGDGWVRYSEGKTNLRNRGQVSICAKHEQAPEIEQRLVASGIRFGQQPRRTTTEFFINSRPLSRWLVENFGHGAAGKTLPAWLLGAPADLRSALFEGYAFADGWRDSRPKYAHEFTQLRTISRNLTIGMKMLAQTLGYSAPCYAVPVTPQTVIEGRTVNQRPAYMLRCSKSDRHSRQIGKYRAGLVRRIEPGQENATVFCIDVAEDHSFIADGIVVHNCKEFSQAKANGAEGDKDIQSALAVVRCIEQTTPRVFTLENVGGYTGSKSYRLITRALDMAGYMWHAEVLNSADFGVPQTRRRLILRAVRGALLPPLPPPVAWVGWYAAIEDLIPTLPESQFAAWQLERLPDHLKGAGLLMQSRTEAQTHDKQYRDDNEPFFTVDVNGCKPKAFIVDGQTNDGGALLTVSHGEAPMYTVSASAEKRPARAWLVSGQNARTEEKGGICVLAENEPSYTVTNATKAPARAWLVAGRVVKMTPRALARFMSCPDWYVLPEKNSLACMVLGNGVPSLLMKEIVTPLIGG